MNLRGVKVLNEERQMYSIKEREMYSIKER